MDKEKILKSNQDQAIASWINYLNQVRLNNMLESFRTADATKLDEIAKINKQLSAALKEIKYTGALVKANPNLGGNNGRHGFIAEIAEVGISNARRLVDGKKPNAVWINNNGQWDITEDGIPYQLKFYNKDFSLSACLEHLKKYPDSLEVNGKYMIPKDQYEKMIKYLDMPESLANKLGTETGDFSLREWKFVNNFFKKNDISKKDFKPSLLEYKEVQAKKIDDTLSKERIKLKTTVNEYKNDAERKAEQEKLEAYEESKPSLAEGAKATFGAAAVEGGMTLCLSIVGKVKSGKQLKDFDENDWKEIAGKTGLSTLKGGTRGASIYMLSNYTATPAAVANALVTAGFGIAEQAYKLRQGEINELSFIEHSEMLCIDVAISALSSAIGHAMIPIPILGAVIGNTIGTTMYQIAKNSLSKIEQEIIREYLLSIDKLKVSLDSQLREYIDLTAKAMEEFINLIDLAFSPDVIIAFNGSIELAKIVGVPTDEILDSKEKIEDYFMN